MIQYLVLGGRNTKTMMQEIGLRCNTSSLLLWTYWNMNMASVITKLEFTPPCQGTQTGQVWPTPVHTTPCHTSTFLHLHMHTSIHSMPPTTSSLSVSISPPSLASTLQNTPFPKTRQANKERFQCRRWKRRENVNVQKTKRDDSFASFE